jgi:hypothetical protein
LKLKIKFLKEVDFEDATSSFKDENTVDILQTETGTLLITEVGQMYDLDDSLHDSIQFMVSDISDTYYFEKFSKGQLVRKFITTQGETAEDVGEGHISEEDDLMEKVWEYIDTHLQNDFTNTMQDQTFKRYELE